MPVERTSGGTSLIDVLDRVLDKGIVIDAWVRVSLVGIDLITVEARVVVASIDTYLKYSEAVGQVPPVSRATIDARAPAAASRLAFAEFLLACDDPAECAQRALEWLGEHADLRHGLCAAVDPEQGRLSGLAGRGLAPSEVSGFGLDLEDRDHPLVAALYAKQPILLPVGAEARKLLPPPLDQSTCLLLPLPLT